MRRGKFGNCKCTPARLAQVKRKEQSVVDIDSSGCLLRRGVTLPSAKEASETQDSECVGGLRNPITAVASSTSLKATGRRIRMVMSKLLQKSEVYSEAKALVESIGKPGCKGFTEDLVLKARMALASEFGSAFPEMDVGKNRSSFQSNLWEAILTDAKDPETEIVDWMRHGCPTG